MICQKSSTHVPHLRNRIMGFLKQQRVQEYRGLLDSIANSILDQLHFIVYSANYKQV